MIHLTSNLALKWDQLEDMAEFFSVSYFARDGRQVDRARRGKLACLRGRNEDECRGVTLLDTSVLLRLTEQNLVLPSMLSPLMIRPPSLQVTCLEQN